METIAQEAKRLLEPIPEEEWLTGTYYEDNKCCAIGHIRDKSDRPIGKWEDIERDGSRFWFELRLRTLAKEFLGELHITEVNDHRQARYPQTTPKQRVMALLDDMIKAGY